MERLDHKVDVKIRLSQSGLQREDVPEALRPEYDRLHGARPSGFNFAQAYQDLKRLGLDDEAFSTAGTDRLLEELHYPHGQSEIADEPHE